MKKQLADLKRAGRVGLERAAEVVETVAHKAEAVVERTVEQVKEVVAEVTSSATSLEDFWRFLSWKALRQHVWKPSTKQVFNLWLILQTIQKKSSWLLKASVLQLSSS